MNHAVRAVVLSLVAIAIAAVVSQTDFKGLAPNPDLTTFGSLLASLLFASAILERALDVWLSLAMGGKADELDGQIRSLKARAEKSPASEAEKRDQLQAESDLKTVMADRTAHSSATRRMALPAALLGGLAISAVGLRSLEPLVLLASISADQAKWFAGIDIVFTGALLAGGSDGIHWIVALYRDWMDKNRSTRK